MGYGYSTISNFTPSHRLDEHGHGLGLRQRLDEHQLLGQLAVRGGTYNDGSGDTATMAGTVTASGCDWGKYNYGQTDALVVRRHVDPEQRQRRGLRRQHGHMGLFRQRHMVAGPAALCSAARRPSRAARPIRWATAPAAASLRAGGWVQSSGTGDASGTADFSYSYSGGGSGSGGGTLRYDDPLT